MALPAGYSSEEDDLCGFEDEIQVRPLNQIYNINNYLKTAGFSTLQRNKTKKSNNKTNTIEDEKREKERKINNLYLVIVNGNIQEVISALDEGINAFLFVDRQNIFVC